MFTVNTNRQIQAEKNYNSHKEKTASVCGKQDISLCGQSEDRHTLLVIYRHGTAQETTHTHTQRHIHTNQSANTEKNEEKRKRPVEELNDNLLAS